MKKILLIGIKDLTLVFRDRAALLLMLLAPFLLTIGLGFITGRFSTTGSGLEQIPVLIVNQDHARLGDALADTFESADLADLVEPTEMDDAAAARKLVDEDGAAAAIIIPDGFTESILPSDETTSPVDPVVVRIEVYANPTRPTSSGVIEAIVEDFLGRVETARVGGRVVVRQLLAHGLIQPAQAAQVGRSIGDRSGAGGSDLIAVRSITSGTGPVRFDALSYMAPGMAFLFLMYTVTYGGRSILAERTQGTLPRLLVSPTSTTQVLGGKVLGIFLTGLAQLAILIVATTLLFSLKWGDPLAVTVLVLTAVFAATGWGMLITALARTPGQVSGVGTAMMLMFGILGGSFVDVSGFPEWLQLVAKITPNAWGLDGFNTLARGGTLADVVTPVAALLVMGGVLFAISVLSFNRRSIMQR